MPVDDRIGPYEVDREIGRGGMGVVYLARDSRLDRDVAIKTLPDHLAQDPARLARFEREARTLAKLNHPNVAGIHGVEEHDGARYLILEYVEGETLTEHLGHGKPLPVEEALDISRQIAAGVEAAHDAGVIHRDLKPDNIKITPDGAVKVLDFGLARVEEGSSPAFSIGQATTRAAPQSPTEPGAILGTAPYMSPEQARGRTADRRSDIWAFGCVFYEMLVGRPAFRGESFSDTLAAVLRSEPDLSLLPSRTPQAATRVVSRCLQKDPRKRLQAIGEARIAIEEYQADPTHHLLGAPGATAMGRPWLPWALVGMMTVAAILTSGLLWSERSRTVSLLGATAGTPVSFELPVHLLRSADENGLALSPGGDALAYISPSVTGEPGMLWVRDLDDPVPRVLPGTEAAVNPFWSPDGRSIGYVQQGTIRAVDRGGGASRILFEAGQTFGPASWSQDGTLLFAPFPASAGDEGILRVSVEGGEPVSVSPPPDEGESGHVFPHWLPDGRRFLYLALSADAERRSQLYLGSVDGGSPRPVRGVHSRAEYASGELFYWEDGTVVARPFDIDQAAFTGDPTPICQTSGAHYARTGMAVFAVAPRGGAVACGRMDKSVELRWFDRSGQDRGRLGEPGIFAEPRISPTGDRVAVEKEDPRTGTDDVWIFDLERGVPTRLVGGPADDDSPVWSTDGERLMFTSDSVGVPRVYNRRADGVGGSTRVQLDEDFPTYVTDWSLDGTSLLYEVVPTVEADIHLAAVDDLEASMLFAGGPGMQEEARFSPDGRWVALASSELGSMEVFVAPLTDGTALQRVSSAGGRAPVWSRDGREIYYAKGATLYAVSFSSGDGTIGSSRELFSLGPRLRIDSFDVEPEGDLFLIAVQDLARSRSSITLVLNRAMPVER